MLIDDKQRVIIHVSGCCYIPSHACPYLPLGENTTNIACPRLSYCQETRVAYNNTLNKALAPPGAGTSMGYESLKNWQSGVAILEDNVFERLSLPEGSSLSEKRKSDRFQVSIPLAYRIKSPKAIWHPVMTEDVSNTGIRLQLEDSPAVGTKMDLDVLLPGAKKNIQIEGTVVWIRPSADGETVIECGIAFQNLKQVTGKEKLLKFITDRLCLFALKNPPKKLKAEPASTLEELKDAFRLIYEEYAARGYCKPNPHQMHYSFYCTLPESRTFLLKKEETVLGTISLIPDSPYGIPMEAIFPEIVQDLRTQGRRIAEVSLLALNREAFNKKSFSLTDFQKMTGTFHLFKTLYDYVRLKTNITDLVIAVHPKHEDLYRYLTYEKIGPCRSYTSACDKPAVPMKIEVDAEGTTQEASDGLIRYFYLHPTPEEILKKRFIWDRHALEELLVEKSFIWQNLPEEYKKFLRKTYPNFNPH